MEMRLLSAALENEIEAAQSETLELIKTLCRIPAPSHREERRAVFIKEWLEARGFPAEIDDAKNVRCGWGVEESGEIAVVMAQIDTLSKQMFIEESQAMAWSYFGLVLIVIVVVYLLVDRHVFYNN